jgi:hypothetical protein
MAELSTVHSAEYYTDDLGQHKLTLYCPEGPNGDAAEDSSLVTVRWM